MRWHTVHCNYYLPDLPGHYWCSCVMSLLDDPYCKIKWHELMSSPDYTRYKDFLTWWKCMCPQIWWISANKHKKKESPLNWGGKILNKRVFTFLTSCTRDSIKFCLFLIQWIQAVQDCYLKENISYDKSSMIKMPLVGKLEAMHRKNLMWWKCGRHFLQVTFHRSEYRSPCSSISVTSFL